MTNQKARDISLDGLKGIAILLVILGHNVQILNDYPDTDPLYRLIYSFHMPLFFFISGCVLALSRFSTQSSVSRLSKKFQHLVIPFIAWFFIQYFLNGKYSQISLYSHFESLFFNADYGLWFLWVLFLMSFLQIAIQGLVKSLNIQITLSLVLWLVTWSLPNILGLAQFRYHYPYFMVAYFGSQIVISSGFKKTFSSLSYLLFPLLVFWWHRQNPPIFLQNFPLEKHLDKLYKYTVAFAGIGVCFFSFHFYLPRETFKPALKKLQWLGQHTLEIYAIHFYFLGMARMAAPGTYSALGLIISSIISLVAALSVSYILIRPSALLSQVLLGAKK